MQRYKQVKGERFDAETSSPRGVFPVEITAWSSQNTLLDTISSRLGTILSRVLSREALIVVVVILVLAPGAGVFMLAPYFPNPPRSSIDRIGASVGIYIILAIAVAIVSFILGLMLWLRNALFGRSTRSDLPRHLSALPLPVPHFDVPSRDIISELAREQARLDPSGQIMRKNARRRFLRVLAGGLLLASTPLFVLDEATRFQPSLAVRFKDGGFSDTFWLSVLMATLGFILLVVTRWRRAVAPYRLWLNAAAWLVFFIVAVALFIALPMATGYLKSIGYDLFARQDTWTGWLFLMAMTFSFGGISFWLLDLGFERLDRAKAFSLTHAEFLLRTDSRAPVLLLRSFADDGIGQTSEFGFEESLQRYLANYGPVIAVADPKQLPQRGAARAFLSDADWQQKVLNWMDEAALIVVLVGGTNAVKWEVGQIIARNHLGKCVLLFPPTRGSRERLAAAIEPFTGSRWEAAVRQMSNWDNLRAFYCHSKGSATVFWSRDSMASDYLVAAAFCVYGLICDRSSVNAGAAKPIAGRP